jgi:hypothetical protein
MLRHALFSLVLIVSLAAIGCADPPEKEMHQAQGAIDAARAAGAETYAPEEFKGAVDALAHAQDAVAQRDYRLALNHALDSRERAQTAAKLAADQKAAARSDAERLLAEVASTIAVGNMRLQALSATPRTPPEATAPLRSALAAARQAVDDAGAALAKQDYLAARQRLQGVSRTLAEAAVAAPVPQPPPPQRPARRPR